MKKKTNIILWTGIGLFFLLYIIIILIHYSRWDGSRELQDSGKWRININSNNFQIIAPDIIIDTFFVETDSLATIEGLHDSLQIAITENPSIQ